MLSSATSPISTSDPSGPKMRLATSCVKWFFLRPGACDHAHAWVRAYDRGTKTTHTFRQTR